MAADSPTILATSGGTRRGTRSELLFGPLVLHAVDLAGVTGRAPRLCHVGTAGGDQRFFQAWLGEAGQAAGIDVCHLNLFSMPNVGPSGPPRKSVTMTADIVITFMNSDR